MISEKDKRRLQNVMAYGEDGKSIEDIPKQRRSLPEEQVREKEIDRFDEGMALYIVKIFSQFPIHS